MPSNDELMDAADALIKFNADWHYYYTHGQGIGNPVKVPWDLYQQAIKMAYHVKSTLATEQAGEQAIDETALCSIGFAPRADAGFWIEGGWADVTVVQLESREWLAVIEGDQHWDWPVGMTIMSEVTALLTALGIDTTTSNREGK